MLFRSPKDWCHEEVACEFPDWVNQLGMEAGLRKESMLFSYAWIRAGSITPLVPKGFRIVSQRMERKGQVECRLCSAEGKISARVQRSKATEENQFFFESCRGDIWKSLDLGPKGDIERAQSAFQIQESIFHQKS